MEQNICPICRKPLKDGECDKCLYIAPYPLDKDIDTINHSIDRYKKISNNKINTSDLIRIAKIRREINSLSPEEKARVDRSRLDEISKHFDQLYLSVKEPAEEIIDTQEKNKTSDSKTKPSKKTDEKKSDYEINNLKSGETYASIVDEMKIDIARDNSEEQESLLDNFKSFESGKPVLNKKDSKTPKVTPSAKPSPIVHQEKTETAKKNIRRSSDIVYEESSREDPEAAPIKSKVTLNEVSTDSKPIRRLHQENDNENKTGESETVPSKSNVTLNEVFTEGKPIERSHLEEDNKKSSSEIKQASPIGFAIIDDEDNDENDSLIDEKDEPEYDIEEDGITEILNGELLEKPVLEREHEQKEKKGFFARIKGIFSRKKKKEKQTEKSNTNKSKKTGLFSDPIEVTITVEKPLIPIPKREDEGAALQIKRAKKAKMKNIFVGVGCLVCLGVILLSMFL